MKFFSSKEANECVQELSTLKPNLTVTRLSSTVSLGKENKRLLDVMPYHSFILLWFVVDAALKAMSARRKNLEPLGELFSVLSSFSYYLIPEISLYLLKGTVLESVFCCCKALSERDWIDFISRRFFEIFVVLSWSLTTSILFKYIFQTCGITFLKATSVSTIKQGNNWRSTSY